MLSNVRLINPTVDSKRLMLLLAFLFHVRRNTGTERLSNWLTVKDVEHREPTPNKKPGYTDPAPYTLNHCII